ncbi:MAG: HDOD domain-containing protein [Opitutaceae bacterium]|nr:HDOD domain-containing protein [Verrucomicrobiales bacterium]
MKSSLSRVAEYEGAFAQGVNREHVLACADRIPPMPHAVLRVLKLLDDPDSDASHLAEAVSSDPVLASALLRLANTTAFAQAGVVASAEQAVTAVGFAKLRSLVLATTLRGMVTFAPADQLVWANALATAMIAQRLAREVAPSSADEVFLMGLLHGLGQLVLLASKDTRATYSQVLRRIRETHVDYVAAEVEEIGFSHPMIGALVASRWNLPPEVCQTILRYHDPMEGIDTPADVKLALVKLSDLVAHAANLGQPEGFPVDVETIEQLARWLGLDLPADGIVTVLIDEAQTQFKAEAHLWA